MDGEGFRKLNLGFDGCGVLVGFKQKSKYYCGRDGFTSCWLLSGGGGCGRHRWKVEKRNLGFIVGGRW